MTARRIDVIFHLDTKRHSLIFDDGIVTTTVEVGRWKEVTTPMAAKKATKKKATKKKK